MVEKLHKLKLLLFILMSFSVISSYGQATAVCNGITVILDSSGNATIAENAVDGGSTGTGTLTFNTNKTIFDCSDIGSNTVTLTVTDSFDGSTDSCPAIVTVVDVTPPTAICQDITVNLDATGNATITPSQIDNGSSDVCTVVTLGLSKTTFDCSNTGSNTVTLTVMDVAGNSSTCIATVTVVDNEDPTISCVGDQTKSTDAGVCYYTVTGTEFDPTSYGDNCSGSTITNDFNASATLAGAQIPNGTTITWTITDSSSNTTDCSFTVTVVDNENPTISCAGPISVDTDLGTCSYDSSNLTAPLGSDNCSVASVDVSPLILSLGANTVTWTVTDESGNTASCTQTVTVVDNENPTISCAGPISVDTDLGTCSYDSLNLTAPLGSDNCSVASVDASPLILSLGANTVTWTVTDGSGNTASCTQEVTVVDNENPTISCAGPISVDADLAICGYDSLNLTAPLGSDNCSVASVDASPPILSLGVNIVTWTVTDGSGNTASCTQEVTVIDTVPPTAVCKDITVQLDASGNATITASELDGGSSDNCGVSSINISRSTFNCGNLGDNSVILTVTDINGNVDSCTAIVTVEDTADGAAVSISASPSTPICQGESVNFTATAISPGTDPHYQWYESGSPVGSDSTTYTTSSLIDGATVYVELRSGACNSYVTSPIFMASVYDLPTVSAPANICLGGTGGASPVSGGIWISSNTSVATITNTGVITAVSTGDVTFTFTDSTTGCSNTTNTVTVNSLPIVTAPSQVCIGAIEIVSPTTGGIWTSSNSGIATVNNAGEIIGVSDGDVTFIYTDSVTGCSATTTTVAVKELPVITSAIASPTNICSEGSSNLVVSTPGGGGGGDVTLVNYNFNSGYNYASLNPQVASGITSTVTSGDLPFTTANGTSTSPIAFTNNVTAGKALKQNDNYGFNNEDGSWTFQLSGSDMALYATFSIYFQARRELPWGQNKRVRVQYRKNSIGSWIDAGRLNLYSNATAWKDFLITLPNLVDNPTSLEIKLDVDDSWGYNFGWPYIGASDIYIDNFQVQGVQGAGESYTYSWVGNTGSDAGLPADAGTPLESNKNINVSPIVTTDYTVTVTNSEGCSTTEIVTVEVYPDPDLQIAVDYCYGVNSVEVYAYSNNGVILTDYEWSTGETTNPIYVDTSQFIQVIATTEEGCTYIASISVGQELIIDGNFTNYDPINTRFQTEYYQNQAYFINNQWNTGLSPEGYYAVNTSAWFNPATNEGYHPNFHGNDHTNNSTGPRNFMMINGSTTTTGNPPRKLIIWEQTVIVEPNTDYYFSAYAMNLNPVSPAELTFEVNGEEPDTSQPIDLNFEDKPTSEAEVNLGNWGRFYGVWSSGSATTAVVRIVNLNTVQGGNDFGLDDISFGTLSPFLYLTSAEGTDAQTVCQDSPIIDITYSVGSGVTSPTVTGLPAGITTSFNGITLRLTGTPTDDPGIYNYLIETTGVCTVLSTEGSITINPIAVVDAGEDILICSTETTVTMAATLSGSATSGIWSGGSGSFNNNLPNAIYTLGTGDTGTVTLTYTTNDPDGSGPCDLASDTVDIIITPIEISDAGTVIPTTNCDDTTVTLSANGTIGQWTVTSGQSANSYSFSDATSPTSSFTGESGETYELTWAIANSSPCADSTSTVTFSMAECVNIFFDGVDDNVDFGDNFNFSGSFSFEIWVKPNAINGFIKTIFSKRDANNMTTGYDLRLVNNSISFYSDNTQILSANGISNNRWYHIAVTFNGSTYKLYFDGMEMDASSGSIPTTNNHSFLIGAMDSNNNSTTKSLSEPVNYFDGCVDELRIWNIDLTEEDIHQMMNQEVEKNSGSVQGVIVPIPISGLAWSDLAEYYQMNQGTPDIADGMLNGIGFVSGKLLNMTESQAETTPLPYTSRVSGQNWETNNTWTEDQVWNPPNSLGVNGEPIDWNIVQLGHNINSGNKNITVLGLISNTGELKMMNSGTENESNQGQMLWVTHYLKLDGSIDLVGESQLIQKPYWDAQHYESWLDESSTGFIERDQQGTMNSFAYNYWSSPVSKWGSGIGNNTAITIEEILNDGTISTDLKNIDFGPPNDSFYADGDLTSPIKIASAWIWKFVNDNSDYANWIFLGSNSGTLGITEGYSMKGVDGDGTLDLKVENQNYAYKGRPNNAVVGLELAGTDLVHTVFKPGYNVSLTGNPFPSALDGDQFIKDNENSTDATLYFWEHWSSGTHQWELYQGGYAIRKVNNGVPAVSHADGLVGGTSRSIPGRYVPVGQGFYVIGDEDGGPVVFRNNQRIFRRETEHGGYSSVFIKGEKGKKNTAIPEDIVDTTMRIRLGFESPDGFHRQVLASFFEGPTDGIDYLYDAKAGDFLANDAFFIQEDQYFVIQAYGEFKVNREIPISVFIDENHSGGIQKFMIDGLENIPDKVEIYIKDYYNKGETYNIKNGSSFEIALEAGEHKDRFALVFKSRLLELDELDKLEDGVILFMNNTTNEIVIQKLAELDFKKVTLFNYLGQVIRTWPSRGLNLRNIRLPVGEVSTGIYIVNLETEQGYITKKVLIE